MDSSLLGSSFEFFLSFLGSLFHFINLCLVIMVAFYINKRFSSRGNTYVNIGVFLQLFTFLFFYFIQYFLMRLIAMENIAIYFSLNGIIGSIGHILFLLGMFKVFQELYQQTSIVAES